MNLWLVTGHLPNLGKIIVPCVTHNNNLAEIQECIDNSSSYKGLVVYKVTKAGGLHLYDKGIEPHLGSWIRA